MRNAVLIAVILLSACLRLAAADPAAEISHGLAVQLNAWNRGDIRAFVDTYAQECTFVGKQILYGRSQLLARYRSSYASPEAMGKLSFTNLRVQQLDSQIAIVIGNWHIDRPATAGGPVGGVFSLVWQLRNGNWRIVLDHSTQDTN